MSGPPSPYGATGAHEPERDGRDAAPHAVAAHDVVTEADVATPPRGARTIEPPTSVRTGASRARIVQVVALVIGLVGAGWVSTDFLRNSWPDMAPRQPVAVDSAGVATLAGVTVSLVEATDLGSSPSLPGSDWQPPAGFRAWRVVLRTDSTNEDLISCDVALVDDRGRQFWANYFVDSFVDGYEWSYTCGVPDPDDDVGPEQALLVLVPADADPQTVRIWSFALNPDYVELEIG